MPDNPTELAEPLPADESSRADPDCLPGWELITLVLGDLITWIAFAVAGRASHERLAAPEPIRAMLNTAAPFMLAWLIVGMAAGTYRGTTLYPLRHVLWRTALAGVIAGPLGVIFRALALRRSVVLSFLLVATGTSTMMLVIWRAGWSRLRRLWWPELP